MGIEKAAFGAIALTATFCVVAQSYLGIPILVLMFLVAQWQTKKDDQFIMVLLRYLDQGHVYDATPRITDYSRRPEGWGKDLPR